MARVTINLRLLYQDVLYSEVQAFIPRAEAIKIPQLNVEERQKKIQEFYKESSSKKDKSMKSQSMKKQSDNEDDNEMVDQVDQDNLPEDIDVDDQEDVEQDLQIQPSQNLNIPYADDDEDISDLSPSLSNLANYGKTKTKRQKGEIQQFIELPNKRPRKNNKKVDEASELMRKEQKQRKRKQYLKKNMQAQQKATFDKILNETGRKFRQREEKQMKDQMQKNQKVFRSLGDVPKIITNYDCKGTKIMLHNTNLFSDEMLTQPNVRMGESCSVCNMAHGKYKTKLGKHFCSVKCYKKIVA